MLGEPIYVESLLSDEEYKECAKKYPNCYGNGNKPPQMFECDFKWRYRMGKGIPASEIVLINKRLEDIRKKFGLVEKPSPESALLEGIKS